MDRVVDFKFGSGEGSNHLILELYSSGNLVLTDSNYEVLALLRSHQFSDDVVLKPGEIYPIACSTNLCTLQSSSEELTTLDSSEAFSAWLSAQAERFTEDIEASLQHQPAGGKQLKKRKGKADSSKSPFFRQLLLTKSSCISFLGPDILDHCIMLAEIDLSLRVDQVLLLDGAHLLAFLEAVRIAATTLLGQLDEPGEGHVLLADQSHEGEETFVDFTPMVLKQHEGKARHSFGSFSEAVDEYFNRIDQQRFLKEQQNRVLAAEKKLAKVHLDQQRIVDNLAKQQLYLQNCAMLLETRTDEVDKVRLVINSALAAEMAWPDVEAMVEMEQKKSNPLALRIARMALSENKIFLRFDSQEVHQGFDSSDDEDEPQGSQIEVEVDLGLSAYANATKLYCSKKVVQYKEAKSVQASTKVLKAAEEQTRKVVSAVSSGSGNVKVVRKVHWFEKFNWFITSEGFLVVAGRDNQQSAIIQKKHMTRDDIFVHADVRGAIPSVVFARVAPKTEGNEDGTNKMRVTPLAIQEAGISVVCRSSAWDAKLLISAYWVQADQVLKSDSFGQPWAEGVVAINGKKNFLPPMPLEMGFGMVFCLDEESAKRHVRDRKLRHYDELESLHSQTMDRFDKYNISFDAGGDDDGVDDAKELDEVVEEADPSEEMVVDVNPVNTDANFSENEDEMEEADLCSTREGECRDGNQQADHEGSFPRNQKQGSEGGDKFPRQKDVKDNGKNSQKKKTVNRKKARRYAEQDEEDVELAMMVLGHASKKSGKTLASLKDDENCMQKKADLKARQSKAGVTTMKGEWPQLLNLLSSEVREVLQQVIDAGLVQEGDIDADVLKDLSLFPVEAGIRVLNDFRDSKTFKVSNKSALLVSIMRTVRKEMEQRSSKLPVNVKQIDQPADPADSFEFDDGAGEDGGYNAEEVDLFTDQPSTQDKLLYALPVCAPYVSMQRFKFKVKLTPGSLKKGKAAKQAMELLPRVKEGTDLERKLIKNVADNEVLAAIVGDVKLAAPGLHQQQIKHKKQRGQK